MYRSGFSFSSVTDESQMICDCKIYDSEVNARLNLTHFWKFGHVGKAVANIHNPSATELNAAPGIEGGPKVA